MTQGGRMGANGAGSDRDHSDRLEAFEKKMLQAGLSKEVTRLFCAYLEQFLTSQGVGFIPEKEIEAVRAGDISHQKDLQENDFAVGRSLLDRTAVIKLNGGLGTSMGMPFAKSLLKVKNDQTFLDVILKQTGVCGTRPKAMTLVLMNSFNTNKDTEDFLQNRGCAAEDQLLWFEQNLYPKILQASMLPAECPEASEMEWNPPGHGDFFAALKTSGMLKRLLQQGKRYAFISNADNLGAVLDPGILGYFVRQELPFLMEVAWRGPADKKGGHIAKKRDGQLILREVAQCPEQDRGHFQDIETHSYFNTNNIWINLESLQQFISENGLPRLPLIINPKTLNPRDEQTPKVYQLETAIGAAIGVFENSSAIHVARDRFLPVKKTDDLLLVRSDCYIFGDDFQLKPNPQRKQQSVAVDLDEQWYKFVDHFEARFPEGPPSLVACDSLTVKGDICFGADVVCRGEVRLENKSGHQVCIEDHQELTGHLVFE